MKIVIDTNFWIYAVLNKIRILEEFEGWEIYTLDKVVEELKQISKRRSKHAMAARIALAMIEKFEVGIIRSRLKADEELLELAKRGFVIATNDEGLLERIKKLGGKVARIRQRKLVEIF